MTNERLSDETKDDQPGLGCIAVVSLLERIAAAVEKKDGLPRNEVYDQLIDAKNREIRDLNQKLEAGWQDAFNRGYKDGFAIGATRIKNAAYKLRKQGNEDMCVAMLAAAKVIDDEG